MEWPNFNCVYIRLISLSINVPNPRPGLICITFYSFDQPLVHRGACRLGRVSLPLSAAVWHHLQKVILRYGPWNVNLLHCLSRPNGGGHRTASPLRACYTVNLIVGPAHIFSSSSWKLQAVQHSRPTGSRLCGQDVCRKSAMSSHHCWSSATGFPLWCRERLYHRP